MIAFLLVKMGHTDFWQQEEDDVQPPGLDMMLTCNGIADIISFFLL